jgi:predicted MPP superfamily phosphohydrolase
MLPHWHLWPAIIGAITGFALIVWLCLRLGKRWGGMNARTRWVAVIAIGFFEAAYWVNVYAWLIEPNLLIVRHVEIVSEDWRGAPITMAVLSDVHIASPHVNAERIERIVQRVNGLAPDLVLLLGDYAGSHEPEAQRSGREQGEVTYGIASFAALDAPLGVVGVLGNHDVWYSRETITRALEEAGVAALWNRHVVLERRGGGQFVVAGIADESTGDPDFGAAFDGAPSDLDSIVISHSPDPFSEMPPGPALMLAGHGHCGQVTIPFVGRPILPLRNRKYGCGLIEEDGRRMYVTAGIGTSILPVRFLNPPEIVLVTIRSGAPSIPSPPPP